MVAEEVEPVFRNELQVVSADHEGSLHLVTHHNALSNTNNIISIEIKSSDITQTLRMRPRIDTFPVKGHFLST